MTLETSRKILKISGILGIICAVFAIITGLAVFGIGGLAATNAEVQAMEGAAEGIAGMLAGGIIALVSGIIALIEGIVSLMASKNNKYGTAAWIFAILGLISSVGNSISSLKSDGPAFGVVSAVVAVALSVLILLAANKVREAWKNEQ